MYEHPPFQDDPNWRETTAYLNSNFWEGDFIATPPTGMKIDSMWDHEFNTFESSKDRSTSIQFPIHRREVKLGNPPMQQSTLTYNSGVKGDPKQINPVVGTGKEVSIPSDHSELANRVDQVDQNDRNDHSDQVDKSDDGSNMEEESVSEDRDDVESQKYLEDDQNSVNSLNESASDIESVSETRVKRKREYDASDSLHRKKKRRKGRSQSHNKGSWTEEEHQLFLEGLEKYGRSKWREISQHVGTRTRIQVASHSQKYFAKTDQGKATRKMRTKRQSDD